YGPELACLQGYAAVNGNEAWVRAIPDASGIPSPTGALATLELAHTMGAVPADRDNPFSQFHSPNDHSDPYGLLRSYNVSLRSPISDDRSVMKLGGTWNNNTTLLEQLDYSLLTCRL